MIENNTSQISQKKRIAAWLVHCFTATGAVFSLLTLHAIFWQEFKLAFYLMAVTIFIDSIDGFMARAANAKEVVPQIDGALLDNIIDYVNYVIVPAFFIIESDLLPYGLRIIGAGIIALASAYQFSQIDAKTNDHFFKGFPSYWNIVIFYLFVWNSSQLVNLLIIIFLAIMVFVPVKYAYLSRPHFLIRNKTIQTIIIIFTLLWALSSAGLLYLYPDTNRQLSFISFGYIIFYILLSLYRTFFPITNNNIEENLNK